MSWIDYLSNPKGHILKKTMFEVLQGRYLQNEQILERLSVSLMTENDLKSFMKLVTDVYEIAYLKAVNDQKEQLQKLGFVANVVSQPKKDG